MFDSLDARSGFSLFFGFTEKDNVKENKCEHKHVKKCIRKFLSYSHNHVNSDQKSQSKFSFSFNCLQRDYSFESVTYNESIDEKGLLLIENALKKQKQT